jgi:hypothetical protein
MVRPGREPLTGEVEVDETIVGGVEKGGGTSETKRWWLLPPRFAAKGLNAFA